MAESSALGVSISEGAPSDRGEVSPNYSGSFDAREKWNGWGHQSKYFFLNSEGEWNSKNASVKIDEIQLPPSHLIPEFMEALKVFLRPEQIAIDHDRRITHSYGRSLRDLLRLRRGIISRAPDVVIYPLSHEECEKIVTLASKHLVDIVPYGGGTNIVGATEPTPKDKTRSVCSLDMRKMNKVLSLDKEAGTAVIEAGALGPDLEAQLHKEGVSLGHDPDSFEYSTLGGWLATCSSGMQSDKYGDIEDMCVSVTLVTPTGTMVTQPVPRNGAGPTLKHLIVGSEGTLGVITKATMKVHRLPPLRIFEGFLFKSFESGAAAIHDLMTKEALPSMIRLYDADETRLSFAMKPDAHPLQQLLSDGIKKYLEYVKKYEIINICLMITGVEGERDDVLFKRGRLHKLIKANGGFSIGTTPGQTWFQKRYDLPLIRDFALDIGIWVDVCESCAPWPNVIPLWKAVKQAVRGTMNRMNVSGWIGCHISHSYKNGACLYFHFGSPLSSDFRVYLACKAAATDAIIKNKGALSHHHGVGFEHLPWIRKYFDKTSLRMLRALKNEVDPNGVCNPGKLIPTEEQSDEKAKDSDFHFWTASAESLPSSTPTLVAKL